MVFSSKLIGINYQSLVEFIFYNLSLFYFLFLNCLIFVLFYPFFHFVIILIIYFLIYLIYLFPCFINVYFNPFNLI